MRCRPVWRISLYQRDTTRSTSDHTQCTLREMTKSAKGRIEDRIVVSADSDFGTILATQGAARPSFILFREPTLLVARDYINALLPALPVLEPELVSGCVAVFRRGRPRVRKLPISG